MTRSDDTESLVKEVDRLNFERSRLQEESVLVDAQIAAAKQRGNYDRDWMRRAITARRLMLARKESIGREIHTIHTRLGVLRRAKVAEHDRQSVDANAMIVHEAYRSLGPEAFLRLVEDAERHYGADLSRFKPKKEKSA